MFMFLYKNTSAKTLSFLAFAFFLSFSLIPDLQAQNLRGKLKDKFKEGAKAERQAEKEAEANKPPGILGENFITDEFKADEYGISGIYYMKKLDEPLVSKIKLELSVSEKKSTEKNATHLPAYMKLLFTTPKKNDYGELELEKDEEEADYAWAGLLVNEGIFATSSTVRVTDGVFFIPPGNAILSFYKTAHEDGSWDYYMESGFLIVRNVEDFEVWKNKREEIQAAAVKAYKSKQDLYASIKAAKVANVEMPKMGKLNSAARQQQALKAYNKKYGSATSRGWTHHYAYIHGDDWKYVTKIENGINTGKPFYREIAMVITRTSDKGECRADLMRYTELYQNGDYQLSTGDVPGPISFMGMPGGILPCERMEAFKSKLAK